MGQGFYCWLVGYTSIPLLLVGMGLFAWAMLRFSSKDTAGGWLLVLLAFIVPNFWSVIAYLLKDFTGYVLPVCAG